MSKILNKICNVRNKHEKLIKLTFLQQQNNWRQVVFAWYMCYFVLLSMFDSIVCATTAKCGVW